MTVSFRPPSARHSLWSQLIAERPAAGAGAEQWLLGAWLVAAFVVVHVALAYVQFYHWTITNGLLFAVLWLLPRRWWPALFAATVAARIVNGVATYTLSGISGPFLGYWSDPLQFVLGNVLEPFLVVTGVLALRAWRVLPSTPVTSRTIGLLHIAAAISATAVVAKDLVYVFNDGFIADVRRGIVFNPVPLGGPGSWDLLGAFAIKNALGTFIGIMLVAPLACWMATPRNRQGSSMILRSALRYLLPTLTMYVLLAASTPGSQFAELLRLLLMSAAVVFAMRHGWRGAAMSVLAASLAIAVEDHLGGSLYSPVWLQLFIAITGAMALLFGAAIDNLREQSALLSRAHRQSAQLAEELHAAATRNLQTEERERRRIAGELHDEFGQNLTAMQTHLKLAEPDFVAVGRLSVSDTLFELTRTMRQNIGGVLESLRPAVVDELGLYGAIDRGSVRRLAEDAGLAFQTQLEGDARLLVSLDEVTRMAAYRLVQGAVTNVVRHARASRCEVRLRISERHRVLWVFIDIRDDGIGRADYLAVGTGLRGMRDRVVALGGRLHLANLKPTGLRLHAVLRQPLAG